MSETPKKPRASTTPGEGRDLLTRLEEEIPGDTCDQFVAGGSRVAPDYYCATCANTRTQHTINEARAALAAQQQKLDTTWEWYRREIENEKAECATKVAQQQHEIARWKEEHRLVLAACQAYREGGDRKDAQLREARAHIETLASAIHPSQNANWTVKALAALAEAHRTDSLDVDATEKASDSSVDYAAAALARQHRFDQEREANKTLQRTVNDQAQRIDSLQAVIDTEIAISYERFQQVETLRTDIEATGEALARLEQEMRHWLTDPDTWEPQEHILKWADTLRALRTGEETR